jgi:hypothetical protein
MMRKANTQLITGAIGFFGSAVNADHSDPDLRKRKTSGSQPADSFLGIALGESQALHHMPPTEAGKALDCIKFAIVIVMIGRPFRQPAHDHYSLSALSLLG